MNQVVTCFLLTIYPLNPSNAEATSKPCRVGIHYSSESPQQELSNEYDRVKIVFKIPCALVESSLSIGRVNQNPTHNSPQNIHLIFDGKFIPRSNIISLDI